MRYYKEQTGKLEVDTHDAVKWALGKGLLALPRR